MDDYITEADIDMRPTYFGLPVTDDDLMTAEEWWDELFANFCCRYSSPYCSCGGTSIPTDISPVLAEMYEDDGEGRYHRLMDSRIDYMREREDMP